MRWITLRPALTILVPWASFRPGSGPMRTARTTRSGHAGPPVSSARPAATMEAGGRWSVHVLRVRRPYVGDRRHDLQPDAHAVDGMVQRLPAIRHRQGWDIGTEPETNAGYRLPLDRVGDVASAAVQCRCDRVGIG